MKNLNDLTLNVDGKLFVLLPTSGENTKLNLSLKDNSLVYHPFVREDFSPFEKNRWVPCYLYEIKHEKVDLFNWVIDWSGGKEKFLPLKLTRPSLVDIVNDEYTPEEKPKIVSSNNSKIELPIIPESLIISFKELWNEVNCK